MQDGREIEGAAKPARPPGSWLMQQTWQDMLFAHWPVPVEDVQPLVPAPLEVDTRDGQAWVSIVTLRATNVRLRYLPPLPLLSTLHQLNFRTYVHHAGEPGVYFVTIDTDNLPAALGARILYRLPYYYARITMQKSGGEVAWSSRRATPGTNPTKLRASFRPAGEPFTPAPGSLDAWLMDRYRLFMITRSGRPKRGEIRHSAWKLCKAAVRVEENSVAAARGVLLPDVEPVLHYASHEDAFFWPLRDA